MAQKLTRPIWWWGGGTEADQTHLVVGRGLAQKLTRPIWWWGGLAQKIRWVLPNHKLDTFLGWPQKAITGLRDKLPCTEKEG